MTSVDRPPTTSATWARPTPGDVVTLARGVPVLLAAGLVVAYLVAGADPRGWWVAGLGTLAWVTDALDGYVARRTSTVTDRGAALDSAVDGVLVLVLSLAVAPVAPWALAGGLLFPAFALVQVRRPAWRRPLPHSLRRRWLGGLLTGTLVVACAPGWPDGAVRVAVGIAVLLVAVSFVVDVRWLERAAGEAGSGLH